MKLIEISKSPRVYIVGLLLSLIVSIFLNCILISSLAISKVKTNIAQENSSEWKRQSGKAYTEMLKVKAGVVDTKVLIPAGSRIDCIMEDKIIDGKAIMSCVEGIFYPPKDY